MLVHDKILAVAEAFGLGELACGNLHDEGFEFRSGLGQGQLACKNAACVEIHVFLHPAESLGVAGDLDERGDGGADNLPRPVTKMTMWEPPEMRSMMPSVSLGLV